MPLYANKWKYDSNFVRPLTDTNQLYIGDASSATSPLGSELAIFEREGAASFFTLNSYDGNGSFFLGGSFGGTAAAKTATPSGSVLAAFTGYGYGDTGVQTGALPGMSIVAVDTWTDASTPTNLFFGSLAASIMRMNVGTATDDNDAYLNTTSGQILHTDYDTNRLYFGSADQSYVEADGGVVIDGDAGDATDAAIRVTGTADVKYVEISGPTANLLRATDTRASSSARGGGAAWGNDDGAALASGDRLGFNLFFGNDGATTRNGASFSAYAASGWASNNYPTYMVIDTAKTSSRIENIRFGGSGTAGVTINETGADQDFRVEGDTDTNLLFADASTDRVGIGNNAPTEKLDLTGNMLISGYINGGTALTDSLPLYANNQTYDGNITNTGKIDLMSPMRYNPTFNANYVFEAPFFNSTKHIGWDYSPTITLNATANAGGPVAVKNTQTIKYSSSQLITSAPTFQSLGVIEATAAVTDNALSGWSGFQAADQYRPSLSTAVTATTANFHGYFASPSVAMKSGSHASAAAVVTNLTAYCGYASALPAVASQTTATNARTLHATNPAKSGSGVITNNIGVDVDAMTAGTTNIGIRIAKANTYSLQLSSTDGTAAGGITFGTDTNLYRSATNTLKTDDKLHVVGELELDGALNHDGTTVGFYGVAPTTRATTGITEAAFTENAGGTAVNVDSTFGGYTVQQIVQALQTIGILT